MDNAFLYAVFISVVSALLTLTAASGVAFVQSFKPIDETGSDEDYVYAKDHVLDHILRCGLIYPVVYIYTWIGICALVNHGAYSSWLRQIV